MCVVLCPPLFLFALSLFVDLISMSFSLSLYLCLSPSPSVNFRTHPNSVFVSHRSFNTHPFTQQQQQTKSSPFFHHFFFPPQDWSDELHSPIHLSTGCKPACFGSVWRGYGNHRGACLDECLSKTGLNFFFFSKKKKPPPKMRRG